MVKIGTETEKTSWCGIQPKLCVVQLAITFLVTWHSIC